MLILYLVLAAAAITTVALGFYHGCKLLAILDEVYAAQKEGLYPKQQIINEIDHAFNILCYLLGVALAIAYLFKILYEHNV